MGKFVISARKYRPVTFDAVIGQGSITTTLKNAIKSDHIGHAYLFCGPRGVGKTTCARIFAKTINCLSLQETTEPCNECVSCKSFNESRSFNIHELDAASNNKVEDIRNLIDQVRIPPQIGKYSIYIIDEVHMLSASAFNAFLKTLEEPPSHAIFILATTEKHKIIPTILSRCQIFDFNRITVEETVKYLELIAKKEKIKYEDDALNIIAQKSDGALRDALTIFDQMASFSNNNIAYREVIDNLNVLDYEYYFKLTDAFLEGGIADVMLVFDEILKEGFDAHNFINGLSKHFRDLLVSSDQQTIQLLEVGSSIKQQYKDQAIKTAPEFLFKCLEITGECDINYKLSNNQRLHVELALLRMCNILSEKKNLTDKAIDKSDTTTENKKIATKDEKTDYQSIIKEEKPLVKANDLKSAYKSKASVSIKDALKKFEQPLESEEKIETDKQEWNEDNINNIKTNPLLVDEVLTEWISFAEKIKDKMPRMYSTLKSQQPVITNDYIIELTLSNHTQEDDFNIKVKNELLNYLRTNLKNDQINFKITISEGSEGNGRKPYTSEDKYKFMLKKNPSLGKLKQEFNLDFE